MLLNLLLWPLYTDEKYTVFYECKNKIEVNVKPPHWDNLIIWDIRKPSEMNLMLVEYISVIYFIS